MAEMEHTLIGCVQEVLHVPERLAGARLAFTLISKDFILT